VDRQHVGSPTYRSTSPPRPRRHVHRQVSRGRARDNLQRRTDISELLRAPRLPLKQQRVGASLHGPWRRPPLCPLRAALRHVGVAAALTTAPTAAPQTSVGLHDHRGIGAHSHTGAGEDNGIDHHENGLRFPYVFIFYRSHYLRPHPYSCHSCPCSSRHHSGAHRI
jgi:hypothetical protein